ncbi:MAG: hypothetical protein ACI9GW_003263 [Halieaceae bacterium]|jgi:hypothetical protein
MSLSIKGPWSHQEIGQYLGRAEFPIRLSCSGGDGYPRLVSLWYQYRDGVVYCVTHKDSKIASLIAADDRVAFEVSTNETPYSGVRGQAQATLKPLGDSPVLSELLNHYLGGVDSSLANWLLSRSDEELLITLRLRRVFSWDYRERMAVGA